MSELLSVRLRQTEGGDHAGLMSQHHRFVKNPGMMIDPGHGKTLVISREQRVAFDEEKGERLHVRIAQADSCLPPRPEIGGRAGGPCGTESKFISVFNEFHARLEIGE